MRELDQKQQQVEKRNTYKKAYALYEGQKLILNTFRSAILSTKEKQGKGLKVLTPTQMFQRLPTALAQVKAGNTSKSLLNETRQIIYYLYQGIEIKKKYTTI